MKKWFTIDMSAPVPVILVNGYIGQYDKVNYADFKLAIDQLKNEGHAKAKIQLNTCGGDMLEGFAIYDYAGQSGMEFDVEIIGVAASMGIILMLMGAEMPAISEHGRVMLHKPKAFVMGEAETMTDMAKVMNDLEADVKKILKARTGQTDEVINSWFVRGKDSWFSAKEAKKFGLVRNIIKSAAAPKVTPPKNASEEDVWRVYNETVINQNLTDMLTIEMLGKLGLPTNATAAQIEVKLAELLNKRDTDAATIANLTTKVEGLEKQIKDAADAATAAVKAKGETFFNTLVEAKKITADKKEEFLKTYMASPEMVESMWGAVQGSRQIQINNSDAGGSDERSKWTYADWMKNDSKGLEKMSVENKAQFDKLLAAHVGA